MSYSEKTWSTEEVATSAGLNQMSDNIALCIRSVETDVLSARGTKTVSFSSENEKSFTITFATDALGGDPGFTSSPMMSLAFVVGAGYFVHRITALSATSASITIKEVDGLSVTGDVGVIWFAVAP